MSATPRDLTLERINRLTQAVGDLMEGQTANTRNVTRLLEGIANRLDRIEANQAALSSEIRGVASEQLLLANRIEESFTRIFHAGKRLDDLEQEP